jgi:hypothetical protein
VTTSLPLLVIYVLATLSLVRLVTVDDLTIGLRDWVAEKAHIGKVLASGTPSRSDRSWHLVWKLTTCPRCLSIWVAAPVTVLAKFQGVWWSWVCGALALWQASSLIAERT